MDLSIFIFKSIAFLVLLALAGYYLKKKRISSPAKIKLIESVKIAANSHVAILDIKGREIVLAISANSITVLESKNA